MKRSKKIFIALTFVLISISGLLSVNGKAFNYLRDGGRVSGTLEFIPNSGFTKTTISHFGEALSQWNQVGKEVGKSSFTLSCSSKTHNKYDFFSSARVEGNEIIFDCRNDGNNYIYREAESYFSAPGYSVFRYNANRKIVEADICINTYNSFSNGAVANTYDVWTVFIHEAGHILGLDHPKNTTDAVMYVHEIGSKYRYPTQDDKDGIYVLYG